MNIGRPRRNTAKHSNPAFAAHRPRRERKSLTASHDPRTARAAVPKGLLSTPFPRAIRKRTPQNRHTHLCRAQPTNEYRKNGHSCVANTPTTKKQRKTRHPRADRAQHSFSAAFLDFPAPRTGRLLYSFTRSESPALNGALAVSSHSGCGCPPCRLFSAFLRLLQRLLCAGTHLCI